MCTSPPALFLATSLGDGDKLWEKFLVIKVRAEMGSVEHRRRESNPRETVLETAPLPKLADKEVNSGRPKEKPPWSVSRWAAP